MITTPDEARTLMCIQAGMGYRHCTAPKCLAWEKYVDLERGKDARNLGYCGLSVVRIVRRHPESDEETTNVLDLSKGGGGCGSGGFVGSNEITR